MEDKYANTYERFGSPKREDVWDFYAKGREVLGEDYDDAASNPRKGYGKPKYGESELKVLTSGKELQDMFIYAFFALGSPAFAQLVDIYRAELDEACAEDKVLKGIIITGLELGVQRNSPDCITQLGALYYTGQIVPQDYKAARNLYELAMGLGSAQAAINLGYIYEYGRTAEPNYSKAYQCYSYAAAISNFPEAIYKMGDILAKGKGQDKDERAAFRLWLRSYEVATDIGDIENKAQAAIRIAPYYLDRDKSDYVEVERDVLYALRLYQEAEIGLRISIRNGFDYYEKRLEQAMDGQSKARAYMDDSFIRE